MNDKLTHSDSNTSPKPEYSNSNRSPNYNRKNISLGLSPVIKRTNGIGKDIGVNIAKKRTSKIKKDSKYFIQKVSGLSCYNGWYKESNNPLYMPTRPLQWSAHGSFPTSKFEKKLGLVVKKENFEDHKSEKLESKQHQLNFQERQNSDSDSDSDSDKLSKEIDQDSNSVKLSEDPETDSDDESQRQCWEREMIEAYEY